ncbi:MAG: hypothetical protein A2015_13715 [Spirochaetes bacterium GWF1_31_7]|nr:MAG: hypothetical protein A2Y30_11110 [Spirochaetes bacterium GWE1_32_154]OHD49875.1 MAG: hypothetical protein A2015_13715 [Spirochaetes bacterium GWF1_31_7]OHD72838.1 MAG: hypothetical protein A2355_17820 [Spirochaetes bacterium RIFOXYB1_FULL_32_8]HBD96296.1 hypothetical protein [Spirochaetia bacterium]HBI37752.1 hypothetical protein [Spirochaetia bacterium]
MNNVVLLAGDLTLDLVLNDNQFDIRAGGSILNTSSVLKKLGHDIDIYSRVGNDIPGQILLDYMKNNQIPINHIVTDTQFRTSVAFCKLDAEHIPYYNFYKDSTPFLLKNISINTNVSLFHFGSSFAYNDSSFPIIQKIIKGCKKINTPISYDLNLRCSLPDRLRRRVLSNIRKSDFVKGAIEDYYYLFKRESIQEIVSFLRSSGVLTGIITKGDQGLVLFNSNEIVDIGIQKKVQNVSTIGCGDAFNAGVISAVLRQVKDKTEIKKIYQDIVQMKMIAEYAVSVVFSYLSGL